MRPSRLRLVRRALPGDTEPHAVLRRLAARAAAIGAPPPAALVGDWFGATAVLAPSVRVAAAPPADAFGVPDRLPSVAGPAGDDGTGRPVGGGWIGYLGYGLTDPGRWARRLPLAAWGWADHLLRRDAAGRWWFEALIGRHAAPPVALAGELAELLAGDPEPDPARWHAGLVRRPVRLRHERAVRQCVAYIEAGEIYQANVCTRFELPAAGDPVDLFAAGVARHAPARAGYLAGPWGALASLSPELFLARHGDLVSSSPIKGTAPRTGGPADPVNAAWLRASAKDRAENVMIVDLVRNDLGRVCAAGTVTVPELLAVHPAPGVWHLVSTVRGQLRPGVSNADLLAATFPPGSVTGAPKLRALDLLTGLEPAPREVYCGAIGMASPLAGLELNVAIRTLEVAAGGPAWIGVGGGITADSDPAAEWSECAAKAAPLLDLLGADRPLASVANATGRSAAPGTEWTQ